jgi:hypothetical protein
MGMLLMMTGFSVEVGANPLEKLIMPGPLIEGHAKYEDDCDQCHRTFEQEGEDDLCLACHEDVAGDVVGSTGFHGKSAWVKGTECRHCHTDHIGREADIVALDQDVFNHEVTDFPLQGTHAGLACDACHKPQDAHRAVAPDCKTCHKDDDAHKGEMDQQCSECHKQDKWKPAKFDHGKTNFPLTGKHDAVACDTCHVALPYKGAPKDCVSCHALTDIHGGDYGDKCADCHATKGWAKSSFRHDRDTKFTLTGKHKNLTCQSCHASGPHAEKLTGQCVDCHQADDIHATRMGTKCKDCHASAGWQPVLFDHAKDTDFPLQQAHARLDCQDCHRQPVGKPETSSQCQSCHAMDDPHLGKLGDKCERCHNQQDWWQGARFNHNLTDFPLLGLHSIAPCEQCHDKPGYEVAAKTCVDCHRDDDTHKQILGTDCSNCHNPNGWLFWSFDHRRQTEFRLDGAHSKLTCAACHTVPSGPAADLAKTCVTCHKMDDRHRGAFGDKCEDCHVTDSFESIKKVRPNR